MFVKPGKNAEGPGGLHVVRVPHTHELVPPEGRNVPDVQYWHRRLVQGDVVLADASAAEPNPAA